MTSQRLPADQDRSPVRRCGYEPWRVYPDLAGRLARARLVHLRRKEAPWNWLAL